jgi:hypothetical protein
MASSGEDGEWDLSEVIRDRGSAYLRPFTGGHSCVRKEASKSGWLAAVEHTGSDA